MLGGVTLFDRQDVFPVLPVTIGDRHGNGRTDRLTMADARENVRRIRFNAHATAAAEALLTPPQFACKKRAVHRHAGGQTAQQRDQRLAVTFPGC